MTGLPAGLVVTRRTPEFDAASLPARSERLSFAQIQELTGLDSTVVGELIELGWITPERTTR